MPAAAPGRSSWKDTTSGSSVLPFYPMDGSSPGDSSGALRVWNPSTRKGELAWKTGSGAIHSYAHPTRNWFAASTAKNLVVWDGDTGKTVCATYPLFLLPRSVPMESSLLGHTVRMFASGLCPTGNCATSYRATWKE